MNIIIPQENETYKNYIDRILISRKNVKDKENYQELHHIIPKCLGGTDEKDNRIFLYAQEHYYAHKLLAQENPDIDGLQYAWWNMCQCQRGGRIFEINSEEFAEARIKASQCTINRLNEYYLTHKSSNFGKKFSEEHRDKISNALTGITRSEETKRLVALHHADVSGNNNPRAKKVKCLETEEVFDTIKDAMEWANLKNRNAIPNNIAGKSRAAGWHPFTHEKLHWIFIEQ